jgi:CRISPR-associated protein Cas2
MRSRYLLCYDVRDDKRLRKAAKVAEAFGYRLQYSVFLCDLSDVERVRLESRLRSVLELSVDSVMLVALGPAGTASLRRFRWLGTRREIYDSGEATIV